MATKTISAQVRLRTDTAANWTSKDPVLLAGEVGIESDTRYCKVGDGTNKWSALGYAQVVCDTEPASGSTNPVTSGGVYDYVGPSFFLSDSDTGEWVGAPIRSKSGVVMSDTEPTDQNVLWLKPL